MPVDDLHAAYQEFLPAWTKMRDCLAEETIKARGEEYLPRLSGQRPSLLTGSPGDVDDGLSYARYLERATFYEALPGTVDGLLGLLFRQPPVIEGVPDELQPLLQNVTADGSPILAYMREIAQEQLLVGRIGILLDFPDAADANPYLTSYRAEQVIDWHSFVVGGVRRLMQVRVYEYDTQVQADGFGVDTIELIRVLELVPDGTEYAYQQRLFRKDEEMSGKEQQWTQVRRTPEGQYFPTSDPIIPTRRGDRLSWIPFLFFNASHLRAEIERPLLLGMANTNLAHYRTAADYRNLLHWSGIVQPWVATVQRADKLLFGSPYAWLLNQGDQAGMLEVNGGASAMLKEAMLADEQRMAKQGARLLDDAKAGVEAEGTVRLRQRASTSALAVLAQTDSLGFTQLLRWLVWWKGGAATPDDTGVSVKVNDTFEETNMSPQDLQSLVASWIQGGISKDTLLYNAKRGGVLPDERTIEEEKALIANEPPEMPKDGEGDDTENEDETEEE